MRRILLTGALFTLALAPGGLVGLPPAHAGCPQDGTLPGSNPQTHSIAGLFYVDDRGGFVKWNSSHDASGIWVYRESNNTTGLQRGGNPVAFNVLGGFGLPPTINPITVGDITLFPNGYPPNGNTWPKELGLHDSCIQGTPDMLLI